MRKPPFALPFLPDGVSASQMRAAGMEEGDCPALWALEHPDFVRAKTQGFRRARAQALLAPTLWANRAALAAWGLSDRVRELNAGVLRLVAEEAGDLPVGGRLGPSGIRFPYDEADVFDDLFACYREQVRALEEAGASFLLVERQTSLADMRAALLAARPTDLPVIVTLTPDRFGDGEELLPALITLQAMGADAVGVDNAPVELSCQMLENAFPHADVPLAARLSVPHAASPLDFAQDAARLAAAGARIFGAGSGARPEYTLALVSKADELPVPPEIDADCRAASSPDGVFFLGDDVELSEPIVCSSHLDDDLIELEHSSASAALVRVESIDDALLLAEHGTLARIPLAVWSDSLPVLEAALRYYQGRLLIDSSSPLGEKVLGPIAEKYGGILY